jgi:hypothetical protein
MPGLNARIPAGRSFAWRATEQANYRLYVSAPVARHPWFRNPLAFATYKKADASRFTIRLPEPEKQLGAVRINAFMIDGVIPLRDGQRVVATNTSDREVAVFLIPTDERILFREPPGGATLEGETTRVTHIPHFGVEIR